MKNNCTNQTRTRYRFGTLLVHCMYRLCTMLIFTTSILSCKKDTDISIFKPTYTNPNILLVIADDMGLDACPGYDLGTFKPSTPNLENMLNTGVRFNNVWSYPTCSPTRSSILTGKYGFRTGVMKVDDELSSSEISIQNYLDNKLGSIYNHAVIGKWHLSKDLNHPTNIGINYYAGSILGGLRSYWDWNLTENNVARTSTEYNTTKYTNLAIDWIENQTQPWFLWLAYNAPHSPLHLPPDDLHSQGILPTDEASIDANPMPYYMAMIESIDSEIGRLLSAMSTTEKENTVIIFIGDNGTPSAVAQEYNTRRVKGTVYQGGINVPMIISGKGVTRFNQAEDALINTTDLFATIASIAGVSVTTINDSQNFKGLLSDLNGNKREFAYAEIGHESGFSDYTIRNKTHKYIRFDDGSEKLFNLSTDPLESVNLLHANRLPLSNSDSLIKEVLIDHLDKIRQ